MQDARPTAPDHPPDPPSSRGDAGGNMPADIPPPAVRPSVGGTVWLCLLMVAAAVVMFLLPCAATTPS